MNKKVGAVVTGGDFQGLGVLRTLAKKDIPILLLDSQYCIGRYSRFGKRFLKSPHPSDTESYLNFLIDLAKKENIHGWVIIPN
jgi:predicted ATP-grasp superfamily ATP-dependent carboligase